MDKSTLRILFVAPEWIDCRPLRSIPALEVEKHTDIRPLMAPEIGFEFDAALIDTSMISLNAIAEIANDIPQLPLILIADSEEQEQLALDALGHGADDYLMTSELSAVAVCRCLRTARKRRAALTELNAAKLTARRQIGMPDHFCQRLTTSLHVVEAFVDTLHRQLEDHPAACMAGPILNEVHQLQTRINDLADSRHIAEGSLVLQRAEHSLGDLAEEAGRQTGARIIVVPSMSHRTAHVLCDREKTLRAVSRIAAGLRARCPEAELSVVVDERSSRFGFQTNLASIDAETATALLSPSGSVGEAGFERGVALELLEMQQIIATVEASTLWFDAPASNKQLATRWLSSILESVAEATLFEVRLEADEQRPQVAAGLAGEEFPTCDWLDSYLQQSVGPQDLVLPQTNDRWLIALSGATAEQRMHRLVAATAVVDSRVKLKGRRLGAYSLPEEFDGFESRMTRSINSQHVLLLHDEASTMSPFIHRLSEEGYDVVSLDNACSEDAARATAIVGHVEGMEDWDSSRLPQVPVFLIGALKNQQRAPSQKIKFIHGETPGSFENLVEALDQAGIAKTSPAPPPKTLARLHAASASNVAAPEA